MSKQFNFKQFTLGCKNSSIKKILFSISTQFNWQNLYFKQFSLAWVHSLVYIWPTDWTLSGAITPGQSWPGNDGNEGALRIPQCSCITEALLSSCLGSSPGHSLGVVVRFCREEHRVFYSPDWLGKFILLIKMNSLSSYSWINMLLKPKYAAYIYGNMKQKGSFKWRTDGLIPEFYPLTYCSWLKSTVYPNNYLLLDGDDNLTLVREILILITMCHVLRFWDEFRVNVQVRYTAYW